MKYFCLLAAFVAVFFPSASGQQSAVVVAMTSPFGISHFALAFCLWAGTIHIYLLLYFSRDKLPYVLTLSLENSLYCLRSTTLTLFLLSNVSDRRITVGDVGCEKYSDNRLLVTLL